MDVDGTETKTNADATEGDEEARVSLRKNTRRSAANERQSILEHAAPAHDSSEDPKPSLNEGIERFETTCAPSCVRRSFDPSQRQESRGKLQRQLPARGLPEHNDMFGLEWTTKTSWRQ